MADSLRRQFPYKVESWQESNAQLVSALNAQSVSTGLIRAVVLVVVVLGIASVLVVSVVQKRREIGILRAMGATRGQILRLFLVQGAIVGALGSVLGLALAVAMIWLFTNFVRGSDGLPLFAITLPLAAGAAGGADCHGLRRAGCDCARAPRRRDGPGAGHPDLTPCPR
jgi:lipoprotein-releasing system permease protein